MAKKRNPQDTTLRNVRATAKRLERLEAKVAKLELKLKALVKR